MTDTGKIFNYFEKNVYPRIKINVKCVKLFLFNEVLNKIKLMLKRL